MTVTKLTQKIISFVLLAKATQSFQDDRADQAISLKENTKIERLFSEGSEDPYDCNCVSIDSRVTDQWCIDDCLCPWCPGCGNDYCAGYCSCDGEKPTTTTPDPNAPTTTTPKPTTHDPSKPICGMPWKYNVIYIDYSINWNDLTSDVQACVDACFNVVIVSFWISGRLADAAQVWGQTMTTAMRQASLDYAHKNGAQILLAGGGATDNIEGAVASDQGAWYGSELAKDAKNLMFDGVDFDCELHPGNYKPFQDGTFQKFTIDSAREARKILGPDALILNAPQAPYFGAWTQEPTLGFTGILQDPECDLTAVSIQFYNQCPTCYISYESLFIDGDLSNADEGHELTGESAVLQMMNNGVDPNKLIVGKPIYSSGFASNGFVDIQELHDWGCKFSGDHGWNTGFMTWMYRRGSDYNDGFGKVIAKGC